MYKVNLKFFLTSGRHPLWRVPWATIFYAFQHNINERNCDGNQLNCNNDLPVIGNKNYALQKPFETDF